MIKELIELLKQFGVSENIIIGLAVISILFGLITAIVKLINWTILKKNQRLLNLNLQPYFSEEDVNRATRYYIPTKFQDEPPSADDEPGKSDTGTNKKLLMPTFLDSDFKDKYYLIFADAGLGKTTFLINLYLNYKGRWLRNLLGWNADQDMKLFPFGSPDIWKDIEKIENKRAAILLLDAFDEDIQAVDDYERRMGEILEATKEFKQIIITCRTQFFPSDKEIPDDTGYCSFGDEQKPYKFKRVYLSVFDETDIKKYLKKRFSFFQRAKRKKAFEVVRKSPTLVMRPMLLSYIEDFVKEDRAFSFSYEIYDVLIDKWIERESRKYGIRQKYGSEEKYRELLRNFSKALALNLYENRVERGGYFITKDDFNKGSHGLPMPDDDNFGMTETEKRSKSLLNRDSEGTYYFCNKSILEYFLAKELFQNGKLLSAFEFEGMSMVKQFLDEMITPFKTLTGEFITLDSKRGQLKELDAATLSKIETLTIHELKDLNVQTLSVFANLKELTVSDKRKYESLYDLYFIWFYWLEKKQLIPREQPAQREFRGGREQVVLDLLPGLRTAALPERRVEHERISVQELLTSQDLLVKAGRTLQPELLEEEEQQEQLKLLNYLDQLELLELSEQFDRQELRKLRKWAERKELLTLLEQPEVLKDLHKNRQHLFEKRERLKKLTSLQLVEIFLNDMKLLQEKLPSCKMIY